MAKRYLKEKKKKNLKLGKYFYIDQNLYKVIKTNAPANLMEAWSFKDNSKVTLLYTDYRKLAKKAVRTSEAASILGVSTRTLKRLCQRGDIPEPQCSIRIDWEGAALEGKYYWWSLQDIINAYEFLLTVHVGRPRKDGAIQPNQNLPTRAEIIAKMSDQVILYTKEGDKYVPAYSPPQF